MLTLPSIWNLVISTIVFIIAVGNLNRILDAKEISKGTIRSLSVFALAYLLSWGSGEIVDWAAGTPAVAAEPNSDVSQLLKDFGK